MGRKALEKSWYKNEQLSLQLGLLLKAEEDQREQSQAGLCPFLKHQAHQVIAVIAFTDGLADYFRLDSDALWCRYGKGGCVFLCGLMRICLVAEL